MKEGVKIEKNPVTMSLEDAIKEIAYIRQMISQMGGNDSEFSRINDILERLDTKVLAPDKAVQEANLILSSKQDYH